MMETPWRDEPSALDWVSETGFHCAIRREPDLGHLCGYVAVLPGHPWHGRDYCSIGAYAHGELTFGAPESATRNLKTGDPAAFWVGFDCAHAGDLCPGDVERGGYFKTGETYRDIAYVSGHVERLARQAERALIAALAKVPGSDPCATCDDKGIASAWVKSASGLEENIDTLCHCPAGKAIEAALIAKGIDIPADVSWVL